jgi:hypothetical protein
LKRLALLFALSSPLVYSFALHAAPIAPVVQYTSGTLLSDDRPFTLGFMFTTTTTFAINALGVWDNGNGDSQQVGIWNSSGTLLVSTTVSGSTTPIDNFQWNSVSFNLAPGTYTIGATFDGGNFLADATGLTLQPGFTWDADEQLEGTGLNFPTFSDGGYGNNGILWADFSAGTTTSTTPEPSSLLLLGTGLLGAAGAIRRKINL